MQKLFIVVSLFTVLFTECKKENKPSPVNINTSISNGFPSGGANYLNGFLYARRYILVPELDTSFSASAGFSNSTLPMSNYYMMFSNVITILGNETAGTVKIDSTEMKWGYSKTSSTLIYRDTTYNPKYKNTVQWTVSGNKNFSSFSTKVTRGFPEIANPDFLPDTIYKSDNITLRSGANNFSNTDSIMVQIQDDLSSVYKYFSGKDSIFTFTKEEIAGLNNGLLNRQIKVYAKNFSNIIVNNNRFVFAMHTDIIKFIKILP